MTNACFAAQGGRFSTLCRRLNADIVAATGRCGEALRRKQHSSQHANSSSPALAGSGITQSCQQLKPLAPPPIFAITLVDHSGRRERDAAAHSRAQFTWLSSPNTSKSKYFLVISAYLPLARIRLMAD